MRSRTKQVVLVADENVLLPLRKCSSLKEEISAYELNTVTYRTKQAPLLATRVLKQLSDDEEGRFPLAAEAVQE